MKNTTFDQRAALDLLSSLALHLAVQMDMNHASFPEDIWADELADLTDVRDLLIANECEVPEVVTHVLEGGASKPADALGGTATKH
ncbi:hypothetical protein OCH239_04335 [Roseivivax halodurans JCM 10272]|uniref:Uncharacterized protein n=1 Tax=Roseivivax halodurans JCM 10272 TaxID=1449350 RepID=X7EE04_9RHOB|nr:hypothetical protein [Roseivivax halodurans]ETX14319.1 hypothetical protein OCH239_04335 [Roseivivax halodurans JCM 10272]